MARLAVNVLGTLQITVADAPLARFESDKARALLAYLAVEADRPHRREALIGLFWPDSSEESARHSLRQALSNLRRAIGDHTAQPPYLLTTRDDIRFNPASDYVLDLADFNAQLAARESHPHPRSVVCGDCVPHLQRAAALYRGKFLHEFFLEDSAEFEEWALVQREALHQRALEALTLLADCFEQQGNWLAARSQALRQLELDPWREEAHRQLIRVLMHEGQRSAALAQYETCRRVLIDELGVEPARETRELYEQIKSGNWQPSLPGISPSQAPISNLQSPTANLPAQLTPFIGRERELAELRQLLADPACRCLTLVGPGGMGKTRLAIETASHLRAVFADGVYFVPFASVNTTRFIVPVIADAIGFAFQSAGPADPKTQLFSYLKEKQALLLMDNLEQLLTEPGIELLAELLVNAPQVKVLATSRELMGLQGEWVFEVRGLPVPESGQAEGSEHTSVELFLQRARRAHVGFTATPEDYAAIVRICRLMDGMPLGIELAAAWVRTLSCGEIARELERGLDFLSVSARDIPARHRSMRAVFEHSWRLLTAEEQGVLRRLAVFRGGFRREAAEPVAGATLAVLSALVTKSLVRRSGAGRYDLHELIRQFAAEHFAEDLEEHTATQARHGNYYLTYFGQADARLRSWAQRETLAELTAEMDNFRIAWNWAITRHDIARLCQVSAALWYLLELRSWFAEGEAIFGNAAEAIQSRAKEIGSRDETLAAANAMRAHAAYFNFRLGNSAAAYTTLLLSAAYLQSSTDQNGGMYALWYLGIVCWDLGKYEEANESLKASLEKARAYGERWYQAMTGQFIGIIALDKGEYDLARRYLSEALVNAREMGDPTLIAHTLGFLSLALQALGETAEAETLLRESLTLTQEIGYRWGIGNAFDGLGLLTQVTNPKEARTLFAASCDVFREIGDLRSLARALSHQGYNSFALGDVADAQDSFIAVLRLAHDGGYVPFALDALAGLAMMWAKTLNAEHALELAIHILQHPAATHDAKARAGGLRAELEMRLTPQQLEAVQTRAHGKTFEAVVDEVLKQTELTSR